MSTPVDHEKTDEPILDTSDALLQELRLTDERTLHSFVSARVNQLGIMLKDIADVMNVKKGSIANLLHTGTLEPDPLGRLTHLVKILELKSPAVIEHLCTLIGQRILTDTIIEGTRDYTNGTPDTRIIPPDATQQRTIKPLTEDQEADLLDTENINKFVTTRLKQINLTKTTLIRRFKTNANDFQDLMQNPVFDIYPERRLYRLAEALDLHSSPPAIRKLCTLAGKPDVAERISLRAEHLGTSRQDILEAAQIDDDTWEQILNKNPSSGHNVAFIRLAKTLNLTIPGVIRHMCELSGQPLNTREIIDAAIPGVSRVR